MADLPLLHSIQYTQASPSNDSCSSTNARVSFDALMALLEDITEDNAAEIFEEGNGYLEALSHSAHIEESKVELTFFEENEADSQAAIFPLPLKLQRSGSQKLSRTQSSSTEIDSCEYSNTQSTLPEDLEFNWNGFNKEAAFLDNFKHFLQHTSIDCQLASLSSMNRNQHDYWINERAQLLDNHTLQTLLFISISQENDGAFYQLCHMGVDLNAANTTGETPLMKATRCNNPDFWRLLIENGANILAPGNEGLLTAAFQLPDKAIYHNAIEHFTNALHNDDTSEIARDCLETHLSALNTEKPRSLKENRAAICTYLNAINHIQRLFNPTETLRRQNQARKLVGFYKQEETNTHKASTENPFDKADPDSAAFLLSRHDTLIPLNTKRSRDDSFEEGKEEAESQLKKNRP